jgi:hypothetical protein
MYRLVKLKEKTCTLVRIIWPYVIIVDEILNGIQ